MNNMPYRLINNGDMYIIPVMYDINNKEIKEGQICLCQHGSIAKKPYKVRILKHIEDGTTLYSDGKKVKADYLVTQLLLENNTVDPKGHKAVLWPYWCKRLTILNL